MQRVRSYPAFPRPVRRDKKAEQAAEVYPSPFRAMGSRIIDDTRPSLTLVWMLAAIEAGCKLALAGGSPVATPGVRTQARPG